MRLLLLFFLLCFSWFSLTAQNSGKLLDDYPLDSPQLRELILGNEEIIIQLGSEELLKLDPVTEPKRYVSTRVLIAYAYASTSRPDSAIKFLSWLDDPSFKEIQYPEAMIGLCVRGIVYMRTMIGTEAYEDYLKAAEIAAAYRDKYNQWIIKSYIGMALYSNGLEREGFPELESAIIGMEEMGYIRQAKNIQSNLAAFYIRSGSYDSALVILNRLTSLPDSLLTGEFKSFSASNAALCYIRLGNFDLADKFIRKGEAMAKETNFTLGILYAENLKANLALEQGDWEKAEQILTHIIVIDSSHILQRAKDLRAYNAFLTGRYHEHLPQYELARMDYIRASKNSTPGSRFPDFTAAYEGLHRVAIKNNDPIEATRVFAKLNHLRDSLLADRTLAGLRYNKSNRLIETQKKRLEIQEQELEAEMLARQRLLAALFAVSLLFIILILIFRNRNIKRAREKTEASNYKLSEYTKELEELAFVVSHNLRESARNISTYTGLFSREIGNNLSDKGKTYLNFMYQASLRTSEMLGDLETYVGIGSHLPEAKAINLNQVWDNVLNTKKAAADPLDIEIKKDKLPSIKGHSATLELLFTELLDNSIKYRNGNSLRVTIAYSQDGDCHKIRFSDDGIGFSEIYKEKIFRVFQRLHSNEEIPGTGIGLPIIDKVIRIYGGKVEVESEEGKGTTFILLLPASAIVG